MPCPICSAPDMITLPSLPGAVLSDGRQVAQALAKVLCPDCGVVAHATPLTPDQVRAIYDTDYDLAAEVAPGDLARAAAYARVIASAQPRAPATVLELGCGGGHVLRALGADWDTTTFHGLEAAPQLAHLAQDDLGGRLQFHQGFAEDHATPGGPLPDCFDLIFSINVIEHTIDPGAYLAAAASRLAPGGRIITTCPAATPPSLELLFYDHIHTLTPAAMARLTSRAGLRLTAHVPLLDGIGDFQMFVLEAGAGDSIALPHADQTVETQAYLAAWADLDETLLDRLGDRPAAALGAGEAAALLRAYAPQTWARIATLYVDDPSGSRSLDKSVTAMTDHAGEVLVLATHPRSHAGLQARFAAQGIDTIPFDDIIPR